MGGVWTFRSSGRDGWVILCDGVERWMCTTVQDRYQLASIRAMTRALAEVHGGVFEDHTLGGIDWRALGWDSKADHDAMLATISEARRQWIGHPLAGRLDQHIVAEKLRLGVPERQPYSVDQMDVLDRLVRRAPEVVAQDVAVQSAA